MNCGHVEERLSEYLERSLPSEEMAGVATHLHECSACSSLLEEMRSVLVVCKGYPRLEPDLALVERILLRTSGRPRTRTFRELLQQYFLRPVLTPRFAVGAALVVLFMALSASLIKPHVTSVASVLSPREWLRQMDRGVQQIYSGGLKAYQAKDDWQAEVSYIKNSVMNKLGFFMEQLDVPKQGKEKTQEPKQPQPNSKGTSEKSSSLRWPVALALEVSLFKGVQL